MPKDDIPTRRPIRELTREQQTAAVLALVAQLTDVQRELLWVIAQALWPDLIVAPDDDGAPGEDAGPDAELIRQCDRLHTIQVAIDLAHEEIADDKKRNRILDAVHAKWFAAEARIFQLREGPRTLAGARAAARVILDLNPDGLEAAAEIANLTDWLAIQCAEYLLGEPAEVGFGT